MGSEQSAPTPRRGQNKLSKPRTNSSANLLKDVPKIPSRESSQNTTSPRRSRYSLFSDDSQRGHGDEGKETRRRRRSIFRSKSSQARNRVLEINSGVDTEFVNPSPVDKPACRVDAEFFVKSSPDLQAQNRQIFNPRASLQHLPHQTHNSRLSLVAEIHPPPLEKVEIARRESVHGEEDDPRLSNPRLSSRVNSDTTLYAPIRRRSLQQPGIVTRKEFAANDSRKSLPSQVKNVDDRNESYYNPSKPTSSPLSNLSPFRRSIPCSSPGQRVQTPNDMDYGHIGAFKLGSLRITNGAVSPVPSDGRPSTAEDEELVMSGRHRISHRQGLSQRSNTLVPADTIKPPWIVVAESPLRQSQDVERGPLTIETQVPYLDPSLALFDFRNKHSPTRSLELAKEYQQDLALSPFSFDASLPPSPAFQVTSKHTAVEDELFEAETGTPTPDTSRSAPRSWDSGYGSGDSPLGLKGPHDLHPNTLAKADSGYSSNLSLRSFEKDIAPAVPSKDGQLTPARESVSRVASSTYSIPHESEGTPPSKRSLPSLAVDSKPPPPQREAPLPPLPAKTTISRQGSFEKRAPAVPPKIPGPTRNDVLRVHKRHQSLPSDPVEKSAVRSSSRGFKDLPVAPNSQSKSQVNKIQKRPQSMVPAKTTPVYTIQAFQSPDETFGIPPVSLETERKLVERVNGFPVASFANTRSTSVGLRKSSSKETLGTIFSVGSAEVRDEIEFARLQGKLPPIPTTIPENPAMVAPRKPAPERRATVQPSSASSVPFWKSFDGRRKSIRTYSREPSPAPVVTSQQAQEDEYEAHVTSFDTISSSLGRSPYDIAGTPTRPASSGANTRAKSMTAQFESEAAARFQRNRNASNESQASTILQSRKSYDSIANGNPFASGTSTANNSRRASRELPPSAHANKGAWKPSSSMPAFSMPSLSMYVPAPPQDPQKSKPPVSMKCQRRSMPVQGSRIPLVGAQTAPLPPKKDTQKPVLAIELGSHAQDPWASQKNFWAQRRKSAGEALQERKSMDFERPGSSRPSIDFQNTSRMNQGMEIRRSATAQPNNDRHYSQQNWDEYGSYEQSQAQRWTGHSTGSHRNYTPQWQHRQTSANYNHTYESPVLPSTDSQYHSYDNAEDDYYPQDDANSVQDTNLPQKIHPRTNSTDEMMFLDRFSSSLGCNYDPSMGFVSGAESRTSGQKSSAPRKSVEASQLYGVDLSNVPLFLQGVRAET
ncbi:hypothetical protein BJ875DRAFT_511365 [Amylocarpus encephaloides]|uniref:Proteophosphoglycan ppg4 n=1 Tax=Amylocarpus encephaloides TaxID=45428 RepID=A0A9P8C512_9HELO|nr:hypothetical protein BJ875DRAFT_511365 [Amylocarpus encephaloides]